MRVLATLASMVRDVPRYVMALLLAVFLISGTAWALLPTEYIIFGKGTLSCERWTESAKTARAGARRAQELLYETEAWIFGYLTAYARWVEDGSGPVTNASPTGYDIVPWIDNYCQDHPHDLVFDATENLIDAIKAKYLIDAIKAK